MQGVLIASVMAFAVSNAPPVWQFNQDGDLEGWRPVESARNVRVADGLLEGDIATGTMFLVCEDLSFEASPYQYFELRIKASRAGVGNLLWGGDGPYEWTQRMPFEVPGGLTFTTVAVLPFWQSAGTIKKLRLDLYAGAEFSVDGMAVKPWAEGAEQTTDVYSWKPEDGLNSWRIAAGNPYFFAPPLKLNLADNRVARVELRSAIQTEAAVLWSVERLPGFFRIPFTIEGDGRRHTYNIELEVPGGRAGPRWHDPVVALGLEVPATVQPDMDLVSFGVSEKPAGSPHVLVSYLGFDEAVNRAGKPCNVVAELQNIGGEVAQDLKVRLVLGEGLRFAGSEPALTVALEPLAPKTRVLWRVRAFDPGTYVVQLASEGVGAPGRVSSTLHFLRSAEMPQAEYVPEPRPVATEWDVFMYYFPGWDKYAVWDPVRRHAPERKPWLGYYDESRAEVVDWQIKAAVENGITGFVLDWYWKEGQPYLTQWIDAYARARYRDQLKLSLMWCNHVGRQTQDDMVKMTQYCIDHYFGWPSYYEMDNKPVLIIWDSLRLREQLGGPEAVRASLDACEETARQAGYDGITFVESGLFMGHSEERFMDLRHEGYDGFTTYHEWMDAMTLAESATEIPYADVVKTAPIAWERHRSDCAAASMFYLPLVETGWDSYPWNGWGPNRMVLTGRTPELFEDLLRKAKAYAVERRPPFILLGPANEWGEGSYIEPCVEFGFGMYEAVRRVFAKGDPASWPLNVDPSDVGLGPYDHEAPRPVAAWTFDETAEGWEALMYVENLRVEDGALRMRSTSDDPALGVDATVDTSKMSHLGIRMAVAPEEGTAATESSGQFFWAFPNGEMRGSASVLFPLVLDGEMHDYSFNLSQNPYWRGAPMRLRFDPCSTAGCTVAIDGIWFE